MEEKPVVALGIATRVLSNEELGVLGARLAVESMERQIQDLKARFPELNGGTSHATPEAMAAPPVEAPQPAKPHWSQTPAGRAKLRKIQKARWAKKRN